MKAGPLIKLIAEDFTVEEKTVRVYFRSLRESGFITTGARGVNAPDMTPLDAARMVIALLACDGPAQAVERVQRFGQLRYSPGTTSRVAWRELVGPDEFKRVFPVNTLEGVLAFYLGRPLALPINDALAWFDANRAALVVRPFEVRAELNRWVMAGGCRVGERIIAFKGDPFDPRFEKIKGGVRTERTVSPVGLDAIALTLRGDVQARADG